MAKSTAATGKSGNVDKNGLTTARVEAIFLSPDPEEGSSGASKELWRYAKGVQLGNRILLPKTSQQRCKKTGKLLKSNDKREVSSLEDLLQRALTPSTWSRPTSAGVVARTRQSTSLSTKRGKSPLILPGREGEFLQRSTTDELPEPRRSKSATCLRRFSDTVSAQRWLSRRGSVSSDRDSLTPSSSRRSSGTSITISVSTPDSPTAAEVLFADEDDEEEAGEVGDSRRKRQRFLLCRRYGNTLTLEDPSEEFVRLRKTATTVHSATRFRPRGDKSSSFKRLLKNKILARMDSTPSMVPRLNLSKPKKKATSKGSVTQSSVDVTPQSSLDTSRSLAEVSRKLIRVSDSAASPTQSPSFLSVTSPSPGGGVCWPASRPSSALSSGKKVQPLSKSPELTLRSVSRPWTPAPSPVPNTRRMSHSRTTGRPRTPAPMVAPLQALNRKVRTILGCASAIMELYTKRSSSQQGSSTSRSEVRFKRDFGNKSRLTELEPKRPAASFAEKVAKYQRSPAISNTKAKERAKIPDKPAIPAKPAKQQQQQQPSQTRQQQQPSQTRPLSKPVDKAVVYPTVKPKSQKTEPLNRPAPVKPLKTIPLVKSPSKPRVLAPQLRPVSHQTKLKGSSPRTLVTVLQKNRAHSRSSKTDSDRPPKREQYTDKDRAAAVVLGDTDIKTTLEKQMKSERGRYVLPKESPAQVYLTQADFEMRIGGLDTALKLLNKALELQPGDKNALVSRSRCRLLLGDANGALEDAEEALTSDKLHVKAIYQKAEVLYHGGRFEEALVFYHIGAKQRPDMEAFHQGIRKAQEAIEVSLGVNQPSRGNKSRLSRDVSTLRGSVPTLPPLNLSMNGGSNFRKKETSLLGALQVDKNYLQKLLKNSTLRNSTEHSQRIVKQAKETLQFLKSREDFWRLQQPLTISSPAAPKPTRRAKLGRQSTRFVVSSMPPLSTSQTSASSMFKEANSSDDTDLKEAGSTKGESWSEEKESLAEDSGILENDNFDAEHEEKDEPFCHSFNGLSLN